MLTLTAYIVNGGNDILQRIGRVGVVDNGGDATLGAQRLEATAHRAQQTHRLQHLVTVCAQQHSRAIDRQQIVGVETAEELHPYLSVADIQQHTVEQHLKHLATEISQRTQRVTAHLRHGILHHHLAIAVVYIRKSKCPLGQTIEEAALRLDVLGKGAVVVEMIVREVGEDTATELQTTNSVLHHRVRRHLHKAVVATLVYHLAQHCVQADGVGRSVGRGNLP